MLHTTLIISQLNTGYLGAPPNLNVTVLNSTVAHLTWDAPFTLDLPGDTDIIAYNITIRDTSVQETILTTNTTITEYYFVNEDCPLRNYAVLIAGVNGLGVGTFGDPVMFVHGCKFVYKYTISVS